MANKNFIVKNGLEVTGNITVTGNFNGRSISGDGTKLDNIENEATADQTASEIRTLVASATDSNVFTDAHQTKLGGIDTDADVTDATNVYNSLGVTAGTATNDIFEVTTKPMIFDADTGGKVEHFAFTVRSLERLGVSAVVIEDKIGLKKNSLFGNDVKQSQDSIENFQHKIQEGKAAQVTDDFMIIARIESLILDAGMEDALNRAKAYIEAGADIIMIHSRHKEAEEIFEFCEKYHKIARRVPLMVVPTSFNSITEKEWEERGVNIVCYANHMLRSSYPAMLKVAESILKHGRSLEASDDCLSIKEILELIPGTK